MRDENKNCLTFYGGFPLYICNMEVKSRAIVLGSIKYGDKGAVLKLYTEAHGLQSYMIHSLYGKKGIVKPSHVLPLTLLEGVFSYRGKGTLERVKEIRVIHQNADLSTDPVLVSVAFFVREVLQNVLREEDSDSDLFEFLVQLLLSLDVDAPSLTWFPHQFLLDLSQFLGFYPDPQAFRTGWYFDQIEGGFCDRPPLHGHCLYPEASAVLCELIRGMVPTGVSKRTRHEVLEGLIDFYRVHYAGFRELNSLEVLREILS